MSPRKRLARADKSFNAGTIGMACAEILREGVLTLHDCEIILRTLGSKTHLVAWPAKYIPQGMEARDLATLAKRTHSLWICLHGEEERNERLRDWDIANAEENLRLLTGAGMTMLEVDVPPQNNVEEHSSKPHHGRIQHWKKVQPVGERGFYIVGSFMDHPMLGKHGGRSRTSQVVKHDGATGEIETRNSRYMLVGPELESWE